MSAYMNRTNPYTALAVVAVEMPDMVSAVLRNLEMLGGVMAKVMPMAQTAAVAAEQQTVVKPTPPAPAAAPSLENIVQPSRRGKAKK